MTDRDPPRGAPHRSAFDAPDAHPAGDPGLASAPTPAADPGIPMLTDVLHLPRYAEAELPANLGDVDWSALALRVQENVMERMLRRTQQMLDEQVQASLRSVVERATEGLAVQLQDTLTQMVRDLVARAVNDELTRAHAEVAARSAREALGAAPTGGPGDDDGIPVLRPVGPLGPLR